MITCNANTLATAAKCFTGINPIQQNAIIIYLLCQIGNGGGGSGGVNAPVVYTTNPNTESLTPSDTTKPAFAYSSDGTGSIYTWNVGSQVWQ